MKRNRPGPLTMIQITAIGIELFMGMVAVVNGWAAIAFLGFGAAVLLAPLTFYRSDL